MAELYNYEQIKAYAVTGLHNLLHSGNDTNLNNFVMILEPLNRIHNKKSIVEFSKSLLLKEKGE